MIGTVLTDVALVIVSVAILVLAGAAWQRNRALRVEVGNVKAELLPNGGGSFRDQMMRRFDELEARIDTGSERLSALEEVVTQPDVRLVKLESDVALLLTRTKGEPK